MNVNQHSPKPTIIISAGGTGGHIFPALTVARELEANYRIIWVGGKKGLETTLVPQHGYRLEQIAIGGVRKKGIFRKVMLPWVMLSALFRALNIIRCYKPVAVVGFGGYAAFPIGIAARLRAKPLFIHEQNSVSGLTNKILAVFATRVLTAFPHVITSRKTVVVGNPVRQEIVAARRHITEVGDKLRILVVGGSLGAKVLNEVVPQACARIAEKIAIITHQIGSGGDVNTLSAIYQAAGINANVVQFITDMAKAYREHDVIICRAGASTVAEVAAVGICAIFVPYPHAVDDHQTGNALYLVLEKAAYLMPQTLLTADSLAQLLSSLDKNMVMQIAKRARELAIINSTQQIVAQIIRNI